MRSTDIDRIIASRPADITAARVTAAGEHWDPERPKSWPARSYEAPPRTRKPPVGWADLAGRRFGRVTVVGCLRVKPDTGWSLWLVRCDCGSYEDRTGRAVLSETGRLCWRCDRLLRLQQGRPLEDPQPRKQWQPASVADVMLSARSVKRSAGMEPRTAMQAALSAALQRSVGGK